MFGFIRRYFRRRKRDEYIKRIISAKSGTIIPVGELDEAEKKEYQYQLKHYEGITLSYDVSTNKYSLWKPNSNLSRNQGNYNPIFLLYNEVHSPYNYK